METDDTPNDYANPQWQQASKIHEWKNYISEPLREIWGTFTDVQQATIAANAQGRASAEDWEG